MRKTKLSEPRSSGSCGKPNSGVRSPTCRASLTWAGSLIDAARSPGQAVSESTGGVRTSMWGV
jgi:hypothetical protein